MLCITLKIILCDRLMCLHGQIRSQRRLTLSGNPIWIQKAVATNLQFIRCRGPAMRAFEL